MPATEAFAQLRLRFVDPIQHDSEVTKYFFPNVGHFI
jgi:hypothetical protein